MKSNDVFSYMEICIGKRQMLGKESTAELYHAVFSYSNNAFPFSVRRYFCFGCFGLSG
jgi:hypothetical protein